MKPGSRMMMSIGCGSATSSSSDLGGGRDVVRGGGTGIIICLVVHYTTKISIVIILTRNSCNSILQSSRWRGARNIFQGREDEAICVLS